MIPMDPALHLIREVMTHTMGHLVAHRAQRTLGGNHLTSVEADYLITRRRLDELAHEQLENSVALQEERVGLERQALVAQTALGGEYISQLRASREAEVGVRLKEIQARYDEAHWSGVLSRHEAFQLLGGSTASGIRLLMLVSEPDVSESCPISFRNDLGREVRGSLKRFLETEFPQGSETPVEFYGKFFRSAVFDVEVKQIEHILSPLSVATIFSDVTRKEVMFHLRLSFGVEAPPYSFSTVYPWNSERQRLCAEGLSEADSLDRVQDTIVALHRLLAAFVADMYFLWLNPFYSPKVLHGDFTQIPTEWQAAVRETIRTLSEQQLRSYLEDLAHKTEANNRPTGEEEAPNDQLLLMGNYRVTEGDEGGLAVDEKTRLVWTRFCLGQGWKDNAPTGVPKLLKLAEAIKEVQNFNEAGGFLGFRHWRVPFKHELLSIIDIEKDGWGAQLFDANVFCTPDGTKTDPQNLMSGFVCIGEQNQDGSYKAAMLNFNHLNISVVEMDEIAWLMPGWCRMVFKLRDPS